MYNYRDGLSPSVLRVSTSSWREGGHPFLLFPCEIFENDHAYKTANGSSLFCRKVAKPFHDFWREEHVGSFAVCFWPW